MPSESLTEDDPTTGAEERLYLTRMSPTGAILQAASWPTSGAVTPEALHVDPAGGLLFAANVGYIGGATIDVGEGPLTSTFLARHAP